MPFCQMLVSFLSFCQLASKFDLCAERRINDIKGAAVKKEKAIVLFS